MRTGIVAFLMGNISALYWPVFPDSQSVLSVFGFVVILTGILYKYRHYFISLAPTLSICFFLVTFLAGFSYTLLYIKYRIPVLDLAQVEGQTIRVKGLITSIPDGDDNRQRFEFLIQARQLLGKSGNKYWDPSFTGKVRLSWYDSYRTLAIGQHWQMDVRLKQPNGLLNPGTFDYEQWLYLNRILATGYVRSGVLWSEAAQALPQNLKPERTSFFTRLAVIRQAIADYLDKTLVDYPYKGLVKALSIGYRHDMEPQQWTVFMHTGTNHLIAISGLHIGLVASLVWFLVHVLWKSSSTLNLRIPAYLSASVLALVAAFFYAAMAGFAIPTQRALIMLAVVFLAIIIRREFSPVYVLLMALFLVLLFDPLSPLAVGFWLSFAAVAIIFFALSSRLVSGAGKFGRWWQLGRIQWSIFVGLLPLMMILFQQVTLISPLANLFAVPLVSLLIVPLTLLASAVLFIFEPAGLQLFALLKWLLDGLFWVLGLLSRWSGSVYYLSDMSWLHIALAAIGCLWLLMPRGWHGRWLGLLLLFPALSVNPVRPEDGQVQMTVLDVGQGLAMVLRTRNHILVYDTGDKYNERFNMADAVIIPYLRLQGVYELDTLIVSHTDRDHAGSITELLQQIPAKTILSGEAGAINEALFSNSKSTDNRPYQPPVQCRQGQQWRWDSVDFKVLSPQQPLEGQSANNRSCVILVTTATQDTILLTGDIEKKTEKQLLKTYPELRAKILQVPHHGSRTSSSSDFLKQLQPEIALFSYGYRNRFKHPANKVVQRYQQMQIKLYNTSNGAIDIKRNLTNNSLLVKQYRLQNRRFWHRKPENL